VPRLIQHSLFLNDGGQAAVDAHKLISMANQIGDFFEAEPDTVAATESVAAHIKRFWDPRMRTELLRWVDQHGEEGLKPIVARALRTHRTLVEPAHA
jgi:formate dehydrogenase subunit delta